MAEIENSIADLNESVNVTKVHFFTFLVFMIYSTIVTQSTSDIEILKNGDVNLPIIDISFELRQFFAFVPFILSVLFINFLYHLNTFATRIDEYKKENGHLFGPETTKIQTRLTPFILNTLFTQNEPNLLTRLIMNSILVTIFFAPTITVVAMQIRYSKYQEPIISITHLALIFFLVAFGNNYLSLFLKRTRRINESSHKNFFIGIFFLFAIGLYFFSENFTPIILLCAVISVGLIFVLDSRSASQIIFLQLVTYLFSFIVLTISAQNSFWILRITSAESKKEIEKLSVEINLFSKKEHKRWIDWGGHSSTN